MTPSPDSFTRRPSLWQALLLLWLPLLLVYSQTFHTPWVFDDTSAIEKNPTLRQWTWLDGPLQPPGDGSPVTARPLLNLTFAINYAISGLDPWSYRAVNLLIHGLSGLLLYGLLRLLLSHGVLPAHYRQSATPLALTAAMLWLLHPLHTHVVTYTSQRAEALAGCMYLLSLYALVRGIIAAGHRRFWWVIAVTVCLMGTMAKETIATLPLLALGMDRIFFADSWRSLWQKRWPVYAGLLASWVFLGLFVIFGGNRAGSAGFLSWQAALDYAAMQPQAIFIYLYRILWPIGLVFDYGVIKATSPMDFVPYLIMLLATVCLCVVGLGRGSKVAFAGVWFFVILLPTSSLIPIVTQTMAEHRAYLSSAAVITLLVITGYELGRSWLTRTRIPACAPPGKIGMVTVSCVCVGLGFLTWQRNTLYADASGLWRDTIHKSPLNSRAYNNLATSLMKRDPVVLEEVLGWLDQAIQLDPRNVNAWSNRGNVLVRMGRMQDAAVAFEHALQIDPLFLEAHNGMGVAMSELRQWDRAITHSRRAVELAPHWNGAWYNLGNACLGAGRFSEAMEAYLRALELNPQQPLAWNNLALALMGQDQFSQARQVLETTLQRFPDYPDAWCNYGQLLVKLNQNREAVGAFQRALQLRADYWKVYFLLAEQLALLGERQHARTILEGVMELAQQRNVPLVWEEAHNRLKTLDTPATP